MRRGHVYLPGEEMLLSSEHLFLRGEHPKYFPSLLVHLSSRSCVALIRWSYKFPRKPGSASSIRLSISITCDPTSGDHLNLVHLKKLHGQLKSCATPRAAERMRTVPCLG